MNAKLRLMTIDVIARLLAISVIILCFAGAAYCQQTTNVTVAHKAQHTEIEEWEDSIRIKLIQVTTFDKDLIYFQKVTRYERKLSSFGYDKDTRFPKGFFKDASGCYLVHYCIKHYILLTLDKVPC